MKLNKLTLAIIVASHITLTGCGTEKRIEEENVNKTAQTANNTIPNNNLQTSELPRVPKTIIDKQHLNRLDSYLSYHETNTHRMYLLNNEKLLIKALKNNKIRQVYLKDEHFDKVLKSENAIKAFADNPKALTDLLEHPTAASKLFNHPKAFTEILKNPKALKVFEQERYFNQVIQNPKNPNTYMIVFNNKSFLQNINNDQKKQDIISDIPEALELYAQKSPEAFKSLSPTKRQSLLFFAIDQPHIINNILSISMINNNGHKQSDPAVITEMINFIEKYIGDGVTLESALKSGLKEHILNRTDLVKTIINNNTARKQLLIDKLAISTVMSDHDLFAALTENIKLEEFNDYITKHNYHGLNTIAKSKPHLEIVSKMYKNKQTEYLNISTLKKYITNSTQLLENFMGHEVSTGRNSELKKLQDEVYQTLLFNENPMSIHSTFTQHQDFSFLSLPYITSKSLESNGAVAIFNSAIADKIFYSVHMYDRSLRDILIASLNDNPNNFSPLNDKIKNIIEQNFDLANKLDKSSQNTLKITPKPITASSMVTINNQYNKFIDIEHPKFSLKLDIGPYLMRNKINITDMLALNDFEFFINNGTEKLNNIERYFTINLDKDSNTYTFWLHDDLFTNQIEKVIMSIPVEKQPFSSQYDRNIAITLNISKKLYADWQAKKIHKASQSSTNETIVVQDVVTSYPYYATSEDAMAAYKFRIKKDSASHNSDIIQYKTNFNLNDPEKLYNLYKAVKNNLLTINASGNYFTVSTPYQEVLFSQELARFCSADCFWNLKKSDTNDKTKNLEWRTRYQE